MTKQRILSLIVIFAISAVALFAGPSRSLAQPQTSTLAASQENYCHKLLQAEEALAYDAQGLKKLLGSELHCPHGVPLEQTLAYVNKTLFDAFQDPYDTIFSPAAGKALEDEIAGTKRAFGGGGIGLMFRVDRSKTLPNKSNTKFTRAGTAQGKSDARQYMQQEPAHFQYTGLIYHVIRGGPAYDAGIKDGDIITQADGVDLIGLDFDQVLSERLRGGENSQVTVTVERGTQVFKRTLTRQAIVADNVWSRDLGDGIYSIVISAFSENTSQLLSDEFDKIGDKARGYIVDVRGNPGGLVSESVAASALFVHDGVIVSQRTRAGGDPLHPKYEKVTWSRHGNSLAIESVDDSTGKLLKTENFSLDDGDSVFGSSSSPVSLISQGKPVVVLADEKSASAAEIFTGAVSENYKPGPDGQGGIFIGVNTYGKFIGQEIVHGPMQTVIRSTTFHYFSPRGEWLGDAFKHRIGLKPTITVHQPANTVPYTSTDAQLQAAIALLKAKSQ